MSSIPAHTETSTQLLLPERIALESVLLRALNSFSLSPNLCIAARNDCAALVNNHWPTRGKVELVPSKLELIVVVANAGLDIMVVHYDAVLARVLVKN